LSAYFFVREDNWDARLSKSLSRITERRCICRFVIVHRRIRCQRCAIPCVENQGLARGSL